MAATAATTIPMRQQRGRATNAVALYLRDKLSIPEIYLNPSAFYRPNGSVLAVERAGGGDVHFVDVVTPPEASALLLSDKFRRSIERLKKFSAHYKYLAVPQGISTANLANDASLFSSDGFGRIGLLRVGPLSEGDPKVDVIVAPERFRVPQDKLTQVDKFLHENSPDIYVRV